MIVNFDSFSLSFLFNSIQFEVIASTIKNSSVLFPNGKVPCDVEFGTFKSEEKCLLGGALFFIMWNSCIQFLPKITSDNSWIYFKKNNFSSYSLSKSSKSSSLEMSICPKCFSLQILVDQLIRTIINTTSLLQLKESFCYYYSDKKTENSEKFNYAATSQFDHQMEQSNCIQVNDSTAITNLKELNSFYNCSNPVVIDYNLLKRFIVQYENCNYSRIIPSNILDIINKQQTKCKHLKVSIGYNYKTIVTYFLFVFLFIEKKEKETYSIFCHQS